MGLLYLVVTEIDRLLYDLADPGLHYVPQILKLSGPNFIQSGINTHVLSFQVSFGVQMYDSYDMKSIAYR